MPVIRSDIGEAEAMVVLRVCSLAVLLVASAVAVDVETEYGTVRGLTVPVDGVTEVNSFKGIPFAAPPVGNLRWANPLKPEPWDDVFVAYTLGSQCPQSPVGLLWLTHPLWDDIEEDCLNLNIYTPADMSGGPYPVMVWFHGGGYTGGGNIQYPGHFLAAQGVIVVVPNYRLGALGFMATPDSTLRGNYGMMDQVLALEFVRDNIANFGGDPESVTIFGQSAGASSSALHFVSPLSQGLVHQAICESGAETNFWAVNWPEQNPENYVYQTAERLDCLRGSDAEMVECMRAIPAELVQENDGLTCTEGYFCQGYAPIIDGPGGFLPEHPEKIRESGEFVKGNLITGICRDDGSLYTLSLIPEADEGDGFTREEFLHYLQSRLLSIWGPQLDEDTREALFKAVDFYYSHWPDREDLWENRDAFNKMITDAAFGMGMERQAKWHYNQANTYVYIQGFRSPNVTFYPDWMGVPHNGELPYVWGYPKLQHNLAVRFDSLIFFDIVGWVDPIDIDYADYVTEMWANFAKYGDPTPTPIDSPNDNPPTRWPEYNLNQQRYLDIDYDIDIRRNYRSRDLAFWHDYLADMTGIPFSTSPAWKPSDAKGMKSDALEKAMEAVVKKSVTEILKVNGMTAEELEAKYRARK